MNIAFYKHFTFFAAAFLFGAIFSINYQIKYDFNANKLRKTRISFV